MHCYAFYFSVTEHLGQDDKITSILYIHVDLIYKRIHFQSDI